MDQKSVELTTEMTELIVACSESVKNKAELSRLLDIPRMTIASALDNLQKDKLCGEIDAKWKKKEIHKDRSKCFTSSG